MQNLYPDRPKPRHEENIRLARLARRGDTRALQKLIELNAGLAYNNAIHYYHMNKTRNQIEDNDLLQAAFVGLTEAAQKFDPERGRKFVTYAHWWVNKRLSEEVKKGHWTTVRPSEKVMRSYLFRWMDEDEQDVYEVSFMKSTQINDSNGGETDDESAILVSDVMRAMNEAGLSMEEELTFLWMHEPSTPPMSYKDVAQELGITTNQAKEYEQGAMDKIRKCMGIP